MKNLRNKASGHAIDFVERLHLIGDFYGQPVILRPWQKTIFRRLFGTLINKRRVVRKCFLLLPRKSSKTFLSACICLYALLTFGNNQVILSAAACQKQAARIFDAMVAIIRQDKFLSSVCEIVTSQSRIAVAHNHSYYCAVASGGDSAHGHDPTVVVLDELHAWKQKKHRDHFVALTTGRGARKEPLTIMISTQTSDRFSLAGEEFEYARSLKGRIENGVVREDGTIENPAYLAVMYYANPDDDWHDEKLWHSVSPALGDFLDIEEYREQHKIAVDIPSRQTVFKTLYLNMPCDESERWMDFDKWKACAGDVNPADGAECFAALDMAPVHDLSALLLAFPIGNKLKVLSFAWCCEEDIRARSQLEKVPYDIWEERGFLTTTPGTSTDFDTVRDDIIALSKKYRIKTLAADKVHGYQIGQELVKAGINVQWFGQGFISMGPPTARVEKLVLDQTLVHPDNPVLNYCIHNVRCERDAADNQKPSNKLRLRHERIDCAVALVMAVGVWMDSLTETQGSVYDKGGLFVV